MFEQRTTESFSALDEVRCKALNAAVATTEYSENSKQEELLVRAEKIYQWLIQDDDDEKE